MRKITHFTLLLPIAALVLSLGSCKMDKNLKFEKIDSSVTIGNYFAKQIGTERFVLEDLIAPEDVIAMNETLSDYISDFGLDITWDIIEQFQEEFDQPLVIPNMSFGPFDIESAMNINDEDLKMLTGNGQIFIMLKAVSSLPVDIDIRIDFLYPDGSVTLNEAPITIYGAGNEAGNEEVRLEITAEQLRAISTATGIIGEVVNANDSVNLRRDSFVEFAFTVEKTGGITL